MGRRQGVKVPFNHSSLLHWRLPFHPLRQFNYQTCTAQGGRITERVCVGATTTLLNSPLKWNPIFASLFQLRVISAIRCVEKHMHRCLHPMVPTLRWWWSFRGKVRVESCLPPRRRDLGIKLLKYVKRTWNGWMDNANVNSISSGLKVSRFWINSGFTRLNGWEESSAIYIYPTRGWHALAPFVVLVVVIRNCYIFTSQHNWLCPVLLDSPTTVIWAWTTSVSKPGASADTEKIKRQEWIDTFIWWKNKE